MFGPLHCTLCMWGQRHYIVISAFGFRVSTAPSLCKYELVLRMSRGCQEICTIYTYISAAGIVTWRIAFCRSQTQREWNFLKAPYSPESKKERLNFIQPSRAFFAAAKIFLAHGKPLIIFVLFFEDPQSLQLCIHFMFSRKRFLPHFENILNYYGKAMPESMQLLLSVLPLPSKFIAIDVKVFTWSSFPFWSLCASAVRGDFDV